MAWLVYYLFHPISLYYCFASHVRHCGDHEAEQPGLYNLRLYVGFIRYTACPIYHAGLGYNEIPFHFKHRLQQHHPVSHIYPAMGQH